MVSKLKADQRLACLIRWINCVIQKLLWLMEEFMAFSCSYWYWELIPQLSMLHDLALCNLLLMVLNDNSFFLVACRRSWFLLPTCLLPYFGLALLRRQLFLVLWEENLEAVVNVGCQLLPPLLYCKLYVFLPLLYCKLYVFLSFFCLNLICYWSMKKCVHVHTNTHVWAILL